MMAAAARRRAALLLLLLPAALTTITMTVRPGEAECCYEYAHPGAELSFEVFTQAGHHLADQKAEVRIAVAQYAFSTDETTEREAESAIENAETEFFPAGEADVYRFTPVSEKTCARARKRGAARVRIARRVAPRRLALSLPNSPARPLSDRARAATRSACTTTSQRAQHSS